MKRILFLVVLLATTLTACTKTPEYSVSFETDGGTEIERVVFSEESEFSLPENPTKEGYTFGGWYTDTEFEHVFTEDQVILSSFTLYAKWIEESDTTAVTFYDGDTVVDVVEVVDFAIPSMPDTTKEGYTFKGWYYDETFTRPYNDGISLFNSIDLYGKWNINVDILLYNTEDDTYLLEDFSGIASELPIPTLTGYTFAGWYLDSDLTQAPVGTDTFDEDTTLYAKWTPVMNYLYLVYQEFALGRVLLEYQEEFILEDVTLNGFTFQGWYSDSELTTPVTSVTGIDETMYVYGKYVEEVMNFPVETDVDLSVLGYYSYLNENNPVIHIHVEDIGTMSLQLFPDVAKNTVDNMIAYIEDNAYNGSTFHRIIEDFMIQGGIVDSTECPIEGAFSENGIVNNVSHTRGALSMARTSVMDSATSQFFIVHEDSLFLDGNYATFGGLVNGFNALDYIATVTTSSSDGPIRHIKIDSITIDYNGYVPGERTCAS